MIIGHVLLVNQLWDVLPINLSTARGYRDVDIPPRICQTELGVFEIFRIHP